ncbi:MAG: hypothetical protein ABI895_27315 [Deltaproteobacteria bacterium]
MAPVVQEPEECRLWTGTEALALPEPTTRVQEMPMRPELRTGANRSVIGPLCAIAWLALCLCLGPTSCLNPFPDDQPSSKDGSGAPEAAQVNEFNPDAPGAPPQANPTPTASAATPGAAGENSTDSAAEPDAGAPSGDAGPDAQAAVVR